MFRARMIAESFCSWGGVEMAHQRSDDKGSTDSVSDYKVWGRAHIRVQVILYRSVCIGRDGHLDQSEAYDIS